MKITENKKGRCTGCCTAALFAGLDGTYDFLLVAPVFLHPAEKDAKNHLTNCYGGYYIEKAGSTKKCDMYPQYWTPGIGGITI